MPDVLTPQVPRLPVLPLSPGGIEVDDRAAKNSLHRQIERLELELSSLFCTTFPRKGFSWTAGARGGAPRLLSVGELELVRDDLVRRLRQNRDALGRRAKVEQDNRRLIEEMMLAPEAHPGLRIKSADIGERSCQTWEVRPRMGPIGLLLNWWRVVISSGCPLAMGHGSRA